ncbi:MAG: GntR family transcriptional regulator [Suipraeoptans sp.]
MKGIVLDIAPSKKQIAYDGIRQMIIEGDFEKDTPLVERQLCEVLNVSRTPVREALRELANESLVEIIEGKGVYVKKIDFKDMIEIFELREALECMTVKLFIERATDDELKRLERLMKEQKDAYDKSDHARYMNNDMKIHKTIAEGAANNRMQIAMRNIYDQIHQMALAVKDDELIRKIAYAAHNKIYKAILKKDTDVAQEEMRKHIVELKNFYRDRYYLL